MAKKLHLYSQRLKRFVDFKWGSQRRFAEDMRLSPQTINQSYFKETPFPGSELMAMLLMHGCDLNWLLGGIGLPPDPDRNEMKAWVEFCAKQAELWQKRIELEKSFEEMHIAAEPKRPYTTEKGEDNG